MCGERNGKRREKRERRRPRKRGIGGGDEVVGEHHDHIGGYRSLDVYSKPCTRRRDEGHLYGWRLSVRTMFIFEIVLKKEERYHWVYDVMLDAEETESNRLASEHHAA